MSYLIKIQKARDFARQAHRGQVYNNKPFYSHPVNVYNLISRLCPTDYNLQVAALLHDILEETSTTYFELERDFGTDVAELVLEVTKTKYNTFKNLKTRRGVILKFADRLSNLVNMDTKDEAWQKRYLRKSKFWYDK